MESKDKNGKVLAPGLGLLAATDERFRCRARQDHTGVTGPELSTHRMPRTIRQGVESLILWPDTPWRFEPNRPSRLGTRDVCHAAMIA